MMYRHIYRDLKMIAVVKGLNPRGMKLFYWLRRRYKGH